MLSTIEILKKARELISKGWCQKAPARTKRGAWCQPSSDHADKFCIIGAIDKICFMGRPTLEATHLYLNTHEILEKYCHPTAWNDEPGRTKKQVLNLLDNIIQQESFV